MTKINVDATHFLDNWAANRQVQLLTIPRVTGEIPVNAAARSVLNNGPQHFLH